ncbi:hypothetical protein GQ600_6025 [Phytophthora cactorum]|nr:hypothetical protein GQ600_6025 [Phytophthora cactorum]
MRKAWTNTLALFFNDRLVLRRDIIRKEGSDWRYIDSIIECLGEVDDTIPKRLADQYRVPPHVESLDNVLLSPRGVHVYINANGCPTA